MTVSVKGITGAPGPVGSVVVVPESDRVQRSLSRMKGMGFLLARSDIRTAEQLNTHLSMVCKEFGKLKIEDEPEPEKGTEDEKPEPERQSKGGRDRMVKGTGSNRGE